MPTISFAQGQQNDLRLLKANKKEVANNFGYFLHFGANLIEIEFSIEFKIVPCLKWLLKTEKMLYADYADSISSVVL